MMRCSPLRFAFCIALLCAVGLRLLTPPGWMPNLDGSAPLVICTGDGVHPVRPTDPASDGRSGKRGHEACAFAGIALDAAPDVTILTAPPALPQAVAAPLPADQVGIAPRWRRPQAARAPPHIA